jgi:hypothetical protein
MSFAQPEAVPEFEAWFSSELPRERAVPVACPRHALAAEAICARCGTFCCEACIDSKDSTLCESCGAMASTERTRSAVIGVAWKLSLAPAFVAVSAASLAFRHREVPIEFAVFVLPLVCVWALLRTRRPAFAWVGTLSSVAMLGWVLIGLFDAGEWSRLGDVAALAIGPVVALQGCFALSRSRGLDIV